ncbi:MAG TPA: 2-C-methyl-D-erythritol 4-phosphate cytidylyltransferase [Motilibacterales bacterium]|nr:2-C-methyl-D-erythritol 4-phosphate cytidylyltransferase [Motilibacterales bacterium]
MPTRPVVAIVPAAGSGERLGAGVPKAMALLAGQPILAHAVRALVADARVGLVVVAAPEGLEDAMAATAAAESRGVPVVGVTGGATRAQSVSLALAVVPEEFDVVLVHDAARCLVPVEVVASVIDAVLAGADSVVPGAPVVDTIRALAADGGSRTIDRSSLRAVQTPQGFRAGVLRRAHAAGDPGATDDAGMVEALGLPVVLVPGHPRAFKVTTAQDLLVAQAILAGPVFAGGDDR